MQSEERELQKISEIYRSASRRDVIPDFHKMWSRAEESFQPQALRQALMSERQKISVPKFHIKERNFAYSQQWFTLPTFQFSALAVLIVTAAVVFSSMQVERKSLALNAVAPSSISYPTDALLDADGVLMKGKLPSRIGNEGESGFLLEIKYETDVFLKI